MRFVYLMGAMVCHFCSMTVVRANALEKPLLIDEINKYEPSVLRVTAITGWASLPSNTPITLSVKLKILEKKFDSTGTLIGASAEFSAFQNWKEGDTYEDQYARIHCAEIDVKAEVIAALKQEKIERYDLQGIKVLLPGTNLLGPSPRPCDQFSKIAVSK